MAAGLSQYPPPKPLRCTSYVQQKGKIKSTNTIPYTHVVLPDIRDVTHPASPPPPTSDFLLPAPISGGLTYSRFPHSSCAHKEKEEEKKRKGHLGKRRHRFLKQTKRKETKLAASSHFVRKEHQTLPCPSGSDGLSPFLYIYLSAYLHQSPPPLLFLSLAFDMRTTGGGGGFPAGKERKAPPPRPPHSLLLSLTVSAAAATVSNNHPPSFFSSPFPRWRPPPLLATGGRGGGL